MTTDRSIALDAATIDDFLGDGGTAVLSLARGDDAYAVPVSYGYDADGATFYLRLGYTPGGEKRGFVEHTDTARLVVYRRVDGEWRSVVATGHLERVDPADVDRNVAQRLQHGDPPLGNMFEVPEEDVSFVLYTFVADAITGRRAPTSA